MPPIAPHITPTTKADCLESWRTSGRISVPSKTGQIAYPIIVNLFECTSVNGLPLDAVIEAQATVHDPIQRFGVIWADERPDRDYPLLVLWQKPDGSGEWVKPQK